jgi:hypothetical protein
MNQPLCHKALEEDIAPKFQAVREALDGRFVRLKRGRLYKGRLAKVDGIILDGAGKVLACAYVVRLDDGTTYLNGKPESRQYWPVDDLEWL